MLNQLRLYCDNILHRNKNLTLLNERIDYFKDRRSEPSARVFDGQLKVVGAGDFGIPEIDASRLTVEFLQKSVREKGCLIARNFFSADEVTEMKSYVDHAFSINNKPNSMVHKYLSKQVDLEEVLEKTRADIEEKRKTNSTYTNTVKTGARLHRPLGNTSYLTAQTPMLAEKLFRLYEKKQLKALLRGYFNREPCVSVYKWVMRRSAAPGTPHDFHQDGAFMGDEISSLNCWIPLSDCGAGYKLHGMDIVPVRFVNAFAKGSGALSWTISPQSVVGEYTERSIVTPTFRAGDMFFFDHLLVHRTQCMPEASGLRYAIETWFFDSGNFPKNQIPLKW